MASFNSNMVTYKGTAKTFTLLEMERATDGFDESRLIGEGGFGRVYEGILEDGKRVAVKVLKRDDQQGSREFIAEVEMLSRLHHRNLVRLIGICTQEHLRCLVYELVPNGSVESHLHGMCNLVRKNSTADQDNCDMGRDLTMNYFDRIDNALFDKYKKKILKMKKSL
jgi:serine/threonine protein kinase